MHCARSSCPSHIADDAHARRAFCTDACRARALRERRAEGLALLTASTTAMERGDVPEWRRLADAGMAVLRSLPSKPLAPEVRELLDELAQEARA
ncbi:hypothetical protein ACWEOW_13390 [Monashia sp. NPDC004114]